MTKTSLETDPGWSNYSLKVVWDNEHARVARLSDEEVRAEFAGKMKYTKSLAKQPVWLMRMGLEYAVQVSWYMHRGNPVPQKVMERFVACKKLDAFALRKSGVIMEGIEKGGTIMAKKTEGKNKEERITAVSILMEVFAQKHVPSDEDIIKDVRKQTKSEKFDSKQLAWYKWKYRKGALKGMDGKTHEICQNGATKAEPKKIAGKASKKTVLKKTVKEEPIEA